MNIEAYIKKILNAKVYDLAIETPVTEAINLSSKLGNNVLIKREDLQPVFSFKLRGAYNKMSQLTSAEKKRGVVCASAGNHAQGVAMSGKYLGVRSVIVMPVITPEIKVQSVKSRGGEVILEGNNFDEACKFALKLSAEQGLTFIHPYDDEDVIAGQGTIAMEILHQVRSNIDAIFVPVGGGGLIAGVAVYAKYLNPKIKIIGVESDESACLKLAMETGRRLILPEVGIFADGVAVAQIGEKTFAIAKKFVDEVITVTTDEICASIKDLFEDTRSIAEPSGALAVAGLKKYVEKYRLKNKNLVAINSGANTSFGRLRHIAERTELGAHKEALLAVTIPEKSGSFLKFCQILGKFNITEFNYRYADQKEARIFVGIELKEGMKSRQILLDKLKSHHYQVVDLTDDEMAKVHIRYMVGGHAQGLQERIFRFQFPEKPGALLKFLTAIGGRWNITLFHYRNHAAAYGRVLMGIAAAPDDQELQKEFDAVGYTYHEESNNPAYRLFLS